MTRAVLLAIGICLCIAVSAGFPRVSARAGVPLQIAESAPTPRPTDDQPPPPPQKRSLPPRPTYPTPTDALDRSPTGTSTATATSTPAQSRTPPATRIPSKTRTKTRTPTRTTTPHPPLLRNPSFESGATIWEARTVSGNGIIQRIPAIARSGNWLALLGDGNRETATLSERFYVLPTQKELTFWYKISSTEACGKYTDVARVLIGTTQLWKLDACKHQVSPRWQQVTVNLRGVAGSVTTVTFELRTDATNPSAWFVDDVEVR